MVEGADWTQGVERISPPSVTNSGRATSPTEQGGKSSSSRLRRFNLAAPLQEAYTPDQPLGGNNLLMNVC